MSAVLLLVLILAGSGPSDLNAITTALRAQSFDVALRLTEQGLRTDPRNARLWTLQGLAHTGLGQQGEALKDYRQATALAPDYLPALQGEAQIEYANKNPRCRETLDRILRLDSGNQVAHAMRAAMAFERGDCTTVVADSSASESVISSQPSALTAYGECLVERKQPAKAMIAFERAMTLQPESWRTHYNLAVANLLSHNASAALRAVQPLLSGSSPQPQIMDIAASAYEELGDTPHAVEILRQAIIAAPEDSSHYLHFADLCFAHQSFQVGIDMLNAGLRKLPRSSQLYLARGVMLAQIGRYGEADRDFAKAAELDPRQSFSSVAEGLTQLQQSNLDAALAITRGQLRANAQDAYLNYLQAEILRQKGAEPGSHDFHEALSSAENAVRLQPNFPLALDLLGTLYLREDKLPLATKQFEKVLAIEPQNESALYHLIVTSRKSGHTQPIPDLMRRLAEAKAAHKELDAKANRYTFVEPNRNQ